MNYKYSLSNHLLIAMPGLDNFLFKHAVIYLCEHSAQGAVGLMINRPMDFALQAVFDQLHVPSVDSTQSSKPLLYGGPVQPERGFVIHRQIGPWRSSLLLQEGVYVTTSNDIIRAIACNNGPEDALIALGFTGWHENQLEQEILKNAWLICPYRAEILYDVPFTDRWKRAANSMGVKIEQLSMFSGNA